jgi:quercetin dioxygenase-like cupin family protein
VKSGMIDKTERATFGGLNVEIIAGGNGDPFSVMDMTVLPGHGSPSHISYGEDKLFLVTVGTLRFHIGDVFHDVKAGQRISVKRGDVHGFFNVGESDACQLLISSPAGHDRLLKTLSELPTPIESDTMDAVCRRFNQKVVDHPKAS